jgi:hypothetical protein
MKEIAEQENSRLGRQKFLTRSLPLKVVEEGEVTPRETAEV